MSHLIVFLEGIGADATRRHTTLATSTSVGDGIMLSADERIAVIASDRRALERMADAKPIVFCVLEKEDEDEDEDVPEHDEETTRAGATLASSS